MGASNQAMEPPGMSTAAHIGPRYAGGSSPSRWAAWRSRHGM
jgi:hypothetical protein